ncbi:hypothetical protein NBZ79_11145 [Sneathiella marina]|uniref:TolB protein n=1 Tax=Sneathiella marina TaxID=2950108 RepID=A0ABY4VY34_9PROT|nr:hypothetical protein [Sneathiella marina]USG59733.1 hypothetical protein NBZ79_11145 [Sneathiella marina]
MSGEQEMNFGLRRIVLSVTLVFLAAIACSPSDYAFKGSVPTYETEDGEPLYRLSVNNPALSADGRYMAFDFHEFARDGRETLRTHLKMGIYDLEKQSIEILAPPIKELQWHSPSFDRSGKKLTFVATCNLKTCPEEAIRTHIMVMDLETKQVEQLTNNKQEIFGWAYSYGSVGAYRIERPWLSRSIVRGYPVFSADGSRIYYVANSGAFTSSIYWWAINRDHWLGYLDLNEPIPPFKVRDDTLLSNDHDAVIFGGGGQISTLDDGRLLFGGIDGKGNNSKYVRDMQASAFTYDNNSDELSVFFDKTDIPLDPNRPKSHLYSLQSIFSSFDGTDIALIRGERDIVSVWHAGDFKDIVTAKQLNLTRIQHVAISGDGNTVAIIPPYSYPVTDIDVFWVADLTRNKLKSFPIRSVLRRAIEAHRPPERV